MYVDIGIGKLAKEKLSKATTNYNGDGDSNRSNNNADDEIKVNETYLLTQNYV